MTPKQRIASTIVVAGATLLAGSPFLMEFLQKWESGRTRVLTVYADKLAGGLPTVCNGLTRHVTSTPIIVGQRWTAAQCEAEETAAVIRMQQRLAPCVRVPIGQGTWDALSSHAWNVGPASTCASRAVALINQGDIEAGCDALAHAPDGKTPVWSYAGGKFYRGLYNRRVDERAACLKQ